MKNMRIGTLTIGQTPRPDLVASLQQRIPNADIVEVGALDPLDYSDLPAEACAQKTNYMLTTRMRDGSLVSIPESFLMPFMASGIRRLEAECVKAIYLMCAGTFAELQSSLPLIKPFDLAHELLCTMGLRNLGIIAPIPAQERPIRERWTAAGFTAEVWTANATEPDDAFIAHVKQMHQENGFQALVLDYVGHPTEVSQEIQAKLHMPVIDLGELAVAALTAIV
ncbi:MAG: AroM family protein [Chloroflexota bacterium]